MNKQNKIPFSTLYKNPVVLLVSLFVLFVVIYFAINHFSTPQSNDQKEGEWLGEKAKPTEKPKDWLVEKTAPTEKSPETSNELKGKMRQIKNASVYDIHLPAEILAADLCWSDNADSFYALSKVGNLYLVSFPGFQKLREGNLGHNASAIKMSRQGLVIIMDKLGVIRLIDPTNFALKAEFPLPEAYDLATTATIDTAYVSTGSNQGNLAIINLAERQIVETIDILKFFKENEATIKKPLFSSNYISSCRSMAVTPTGQYLFISEGYNLNRLRIENNSLVFEEMGPNIGSSSGHVAISPDSKYVGLIADSDHHIENFPNFGSSYSFIFSVKDLATPIMPVKTTSSNNTAIGFDRAGKLLYLSSYENQLITAAPDGRILETYSLKSSSEWDRTRQFLVHPAGKSLLLLTEKKLFWVTLH